MSNTRYVEKTIHESKLQVPEIRSLLDSPLGDDVQILPAMLELSEEDKSTLTRGSVQRTKVLQHLFADLILGESRFLRESKFSNLNVELIEKVFNNQGRTLTYIRDIWKNRSADDITATSGSDLVRLSDGNWYAIEDNLGNISGRASTYPVHKKFYETIGEKKNLTDDFTQAIECFKQEKNSLRPTAILPPDKNGFLERERYQEALTKLQIEHVESRDINENFDPESLINFNLKDFPRGKKGIAKFFQETSLSFFEAPYFKIICDKTFFPFIDDLTRFYLHEEPLIPSLPSTKWEHDYLPENLKSKVLKMTAGHQGEGIYIFDEMREEEIEALKGELKAYKELPQMLIQDRVYPSILKELKFNPKEEYQLELRLVNYAIGFQKVYCSKNITARVIPLSTGDSRCHISRGALFTTVS